MKFDIRHKPAHLSQSRPGVVKERPNKGIQHERDGVREVFGRLWGVGGGGRAERRKEEEKERDNCL